MSRRETSRSVVGVCRVGIAVAVLVAFWAGDGRSVFAQLPLSSPADVSLDPRPFARIGPLVEKWRADGQMSGCVVAIGHRGRLVYLKAFGHRSLRPQRVAMTADTLFDLASLTKPIATATSVIRLIDEGKLRLHDRVSAYLPEFAAEGKEKITVFHLLTHQAGLIPDNALADYEMGPEEARRRIMKLKPLSPPGEKFRYTDAGFIVLGWLVEEISGKPLDRYVREEIFAPLGMEDTGYLPAESLRERAAATEQREGRWMQGEVHDPRAHLLGGVAGHAGLFSTASDLAIYAQMMLNQGRMGDCKIMSPRAVDVMTRGYRVSSGLRGLGWDKQTGYSSNRGDWMTSSAFGHGGFTGTAIWIDPELDLFVVFLSSRLHPDGKGSVNRLAGRIGTLAASAIPVRSAHAAPNSVGTRTARSAVLTGIDVLQQEGMERFRGKRVGLITNHTGVDRSGRPTGVVLKECDDVKLVALFSPEHGIAGKLDVASIADAKDSKTGLPVYSLYGKTRKPTKEMLAGVDLLVFDIQDIGCRFYTYISTMGLAMEAAAESGKEFVVLDRPNPIGGLRVAGPLLDRGKESFVGYHRMPLRHGMTIGELARMFRAEKKLELNLTVIPMQNWNRSMLFDETGLYWIDPSPNMRSLHAALLYPGVGLLETTNVSVGRGTPTPFELFGAPWIDGRKMAEDLNRQRHRGLSFVPVRFTPQSSKYEGEECEGVRILVTRQADIEPIRLGLAMASWLRKHCGEDWQTKSLPRLLGNDVVFELIQRGDSAGKMEAAFSGDLDEFLSRRRRYLLYE